MNEPENISAIELDGQRLEFFEPNLTLAYAALAPLVTKAQALYRAGEDEDGYTALREAVTVIEQVTQVIGICKLTVDEKGDK